MKIDNRSVINTFTKLDKTIIRHIYTEYSFDNYRIRVSSNCVELLLDGSSFN